MTAFWEVFEPRCGSAELRAKDRNGALEELLSLLVAGERLSRKEGKKALELLRKREELGSTGIGGGVAIPHVKMEGLGSLAAAFGISRAGLDFRSVDGEPVRVVILVVRPETGSEEHLQFLRWVAQLVRHRDFLRFALACADPAEFVALLREFSESSAS